MTRAAVGAAALLVLVAVGGRPAVAAPSEAERQARRSFKVAEEHFRAGMFAEALTEYQAGYDAFPLPGFLINIAQCQRRLGDLRKARASYQKFIMVAPDSPHVPEVTALIAELDKLIAELGPADEAERARSEPPPAPPPALHAAAQSPEPAAALVSAPPAAAEPAPSHRRRWWLWGVVGVAVVGAGATVAVLALRSPGTTVVHDGSLGTLRQ
jgi:hypothetical protein